MGTPAPRIAFRWSCMAACLLAIAACQRTQPALQAAHEAIAATLPAPYVEDLVTESARLDGHRLVLVIRSPEGTAAATRDDPRFDELRDSEARQMHELCALPSIRPLIGTGAVLVRRFVDRNDGVFFEVELPARDCVEADATTGDRTT